MKGDRGRKARHQRYRDRGRWNAKRSQPDGPVGERHAGDELTHYEPKKDPQAIAIRRLAKKGDSARKIAKTLGISRERVNTILDGSR